MRDRFGTDLERATVGAGASFGGTRAAGVFDQRGLPAQGTAARRHQRQRIPQPTRRRGLSLRPAVSHPAACGGDAAVSLLPGGKRGPGSGFVFRPPGQLVLLVRDARGRTCRISIYAHNGYS